MWTTVYQKALLALYSDVLFSDATGLSNVWHWLLSAIAVSTANNCTRPVCICLHSTENTVNLIWMLQNLAEINTSLSRNRTTLVTDDLVSSEQIRAVFPMVLPCSLH